MKNLPGWRRWFQALTEPGITPALDSVIEQQRELLPVLWLMGKTGAGKSSIIQRLTGDTRAQIGNGFQPCTQTSFHYDHPATAPVMRFLDTRGLGEAGYDPKEDLDMAQNGSHALLLLTRVDDPSQEAIAAALKKLGNTRNTLAILHVHTALHTISGNDLDRAISFNTQQVEQILGYPVPSVRIDFTEADDGFDDPDVGLSQLQEAIVALVPQLVQVIMSKTGESDEETLFLSVRKEILSYSSASAAADVLPAVGLIAVPTVQGKMLHALAGRYGLTWNKRLAGEFVTALGTTFLYRYLVSLGLREISKFIPVYGQSVGAAAAASISFASTYAIGRAACLYFFRRQHNQNVDQTALREAFVNAFEQGKDDTTKSINIR